MDWLFWFLVSLVFYIYLGYPLTLLVLCKVLGPVHVNKKDITPFMTLLIPAYNEEKIIQKKLENSLSLDYPEDKIEIIVISDASTDNTNEIAKRFSKNGIRLIVQDKRQGKVAGLNRAVKESKGEIILFTDANTIYKEDAIKKLARNFYDKKVGCVCGELKYTHADKCVVGEEETLYWRYENFLKEKESFLGSLLVTNGSIYAIRKDLFCDIEDDLADDFVNPMRVSASGFMVIYEPEALAFEKATSSHSEQFRQKIRIISQGYKASSKLWKLIFMTGFLRIYEFLFHKFLRWCVPFMLIIIFALNLFLLNTKFYIEILTIQLVFYFCAVLGCFLRGFNIKVTIFSLPFYFSMINFASMLGFFRFLTGKQKATWEKAKTTR